MAIENRYITVAYKLYVRDDDSTEDELMEECDSRHPFQFISQLGAVLPAFEAALVDKAKGEPFNFVIPSKDAYGDFCDELMFDVEKSVFMTDGKFDDKFFYEGRVVPMRNENGDTFNAIIMEIKDNAVTINLNHPRAGMDLHFVGTVVENRIATNTEIASLLNEMGSGCGGCGGGNCGGNCGGGCGGGCCG